MNWLRRFMFGRYGADQLSLFLFALYLVLYLISGLLRYTPLFLLGAILSWIALLPAVAALFRMLSRNIPRRRAENAKFLTLVGPVVRWFKLRRTIHRDKDHCYFKCPNCGQQLRVPRGKGKITVTCRSCGATFQENS